MKRIYVLLVALLTAAMASAQTELTTTKAKPLQKTTSKKRVSVHDPSVVFNPKNNRYYIFGSHKAGAQTADMMNWTQSNPKWKAGTNNNAANTDSVTVLFIIYLTKNQLITNKNSPDVGEGKYTLFFQIINAVR